MITIDSVNNDDDFQKATVRLLEIWSAVPGDADWEEHSKLVKLISEYEDRYHEPPAPDPVDVLQYYMERQHK